MPQVHFIRVTHTHLATTQIQAYFINKTHKTKKSLFEEIQQVSIIWFKKKIPQSFNTFLQLQAAMQNRTVRQGKGEANILN